MISRGAEETCHRVDIRSSVLVRLLPRGRRDYRIRPKSWPSNGLDSSRDFLVFLFLVEPDTLVSRLGAATFFCSRAYWCVNNRKNVALHSAPFALLG